MEHSSEMSKPPEGRRTRRGSEDSSGTAPVQHPLLDVQQQAGNRAMQQLLRSGAIQPKLSVSQPSDPAEQQADATADHIMRSHAGPSAVAAGCSCEGEDEKCDECRASQPVARKAAGAGAAGSSAHHAVNSILRSPGRALDPATRSFFEPRFGRDFGNVRIHTGAEAENSARAIEAKAYTLGEDIVFGAGEFAPESEAGRRLLGHELTHVVQQEDGTPATTRLQRQPARPATPSAASPSIDALWTDLHNFVDHGNEVLAVVDGRIRSYIQNYDAAYDAVTQRLSAAQKKEAEEKKWETALEFVVVVGIGLAGGELFAACGELVEEAVELLPEALSESAGEVVKKTGEIGAMKALGPSESEVDFGLSAEVDKNLVARGYLDNLAQGWRGMAEIAQAVLHFDTLVRSAERRSAVLPNKDILRIRQSLTNAQEKLARFLATADTPVLERSQRQIEIDLWIRWMSKSEANAGAAQGDEEIAEHVQEIGVYHDMVGGSDAFREANLQVERLNQLGKVGVVVIPPFWSMNQSHPGPGVVHIRPDAYRAAGRVEPRQGGASTYVQIEWQEGSHLLTGDVVILADTSPDLPPNLMPHTHTDTERAGGLLPKRLGPLLSVDPGERAEALKFLGVDEAAYPRVGSHVVGQDTYIPLSPDRARPFVFQVREAVEGMHVRPPLVVTESEEGVMVSEAGGARLLLFTAYTSWGEAKQAQSRTGVRRVVAVALNPSNIFQDFSDGGVSVTRHADFTAEILLARAGLNL